MPSATVGETAPRPLTYTTSGSPALAGLLVVTTAPFAWVSAAGPAPLAVVVNSPGDEVAVYKVIGFDFTPLLMTWIVAKLYVGVAKGMMKLICPGLT